MSTKADYDAIPTAGDENIDIRDADYYSCRDALTFAAIRPRPCPPSLLYSAIQIYSSLSLLSALALSVGQRDLLTDEAADKQPT
jgi:hypothetical protein